MKLVLTDYHDRIGTITFNNAKHCSHGQYSASGVRNHPKGGPECQPGCADRPPPAIADLLRFSGHVEEYPLASRSTGIHALGDRPEVRHAEEGGSKDRARRSQKTRTPSQAEFHLIGLCSGTPTQS